MKIRLLNGYCSPFHTVEAYSKTYANCINPLPDSSEWGTPQYVVYLPIVTRPTGRPRTIRRRDEDETQGVRRNQKKCGKCGALGHNKKTCKGAPKKKTQPKKKTDPKVGANRQSPQRFGLQTSQPLTPSHPQSGSDTGLLMTPSSAVTRGTIRGRGKRGIAKGRGGEGHDVQQQPQGQGNLSP